MDALSNAHVFYMLSSMLLQAAFSSAMLPFLQFSTDSIAWQVHLCGYVLALVSVVLNDCCDSFHW
jgi:hypothetical protein